MFIELSYPISQETTVMESALKTEFVKPRSRMSAGQHSNTSYIELFAHAGTHIDAPWHFNDEGGRINDFAIGDFVFAHVLHIQIPVKAWEPIPVEPLQQWEEQIRAADALLIESGFAAVRNSNPKLYVEATPGLSLEAARYLATFTNLRCIGVDFISVENVKRGREIGFPIHHALLDRETPLILLEDANFSVLVGKAIKRLYLFPLRLEGVEASPVTAVVEI